MKARLRIVNRYGTFFCEPADGDIHQETDEFRKLLKGITVMSCPLNNGSHMILHRAMINDSLFFIDPVQ